MDVFYAYTYATAGWLSLQGVSLAAVPQLTTTMLLDESRPPTSIEIYFGRCFGFTLLTVAVLTIMLTGSVPLNSTIAEPVTTEDADPKAPYAVPTMIITSLFHGVSAFYAYVRYLGTGQVAFAIGMVGYSVVASIGLWCVLFASSDGKISRKTGADKRTTGFPFSNKEAAKKHAGKKSS